MLYREKRRQEVLAVRELGEKIGYGNMMDIAQALMAMKSPAVDFVPTHVITSVYRMKRRDARGKIVELKGRIYELFNYLDPKKEPDAFGPWALAKREELQANWEGWI